MDKFGFNELLNKLENKGIISVEANEKLQKLLDLNNMTFARIFLILAGFNALIFAMLGFSTFFVGGWVEYSSTVRTILGLFPLLIGGAAYAFVLIKDKESKMKLEAVTMFFGLMIGLSVFLVKGAQQIEGSFNDVIKVWLVLLIPLLYINRASWIALLYLGLNLIHLQPDFRLFFRPEDPALITNSMYFWIYFAAFVPHFIINLNQQSNRQSFRMIFLGWLAVITVISGNILAIKAGQFFWVPATLIGMYVIGKKYYSANNTFLSRPFQTTTMLVLPIVFIAMTERYLLQVIQGLISFDGMDFWTTEHYIHFALGIIAFGLVTGYVLKNRNEHPEWNKLIIYMPFVVVFILLSMYLNEYDIVNLTWWLVLAINLYVFIYAFHAMFQGSNNNNVLYMIYGLVVLAQLMSQVYQNMDRANWVKALFFLGVGGLFYVIVLLFRDDLKTE